MHKTILVPIDVNHPSSWENTLPIAIDFAKKDNGKLLLFSVVPDFGMSMVGSYFPERLCGKGTGARRNRAASDRR